MLQKSDPSHRSSSKSLSLPSATQGKQQEVCLTTVGLDPIFAANQSFGDRKFTLHGSATELVRRREAGNNLFGPRFTCQWGVKHLLNAAFSFIFRSVPNALTTSELMEEISSNGRVEKGRMKCDLCIQLFSVRCIITFRALFLLNCQFLHGKAKTYPLTRRRKSQTRRPISLPIAHPKSSLMIQIGVGPLPLQFFC